MLLMLLEKPASDMEAVNGGIQICQWSEIFKCYVLITLTYEEVYTSTIRRVKEKRDQEPELLIIFH